MTSIHTPALPADPLVIGGTVLPNRFMLGTARYPSPAHVAQAIEASLPSVVTVGLSSAPLAGGPPPSDSLEPIREAVRRTGAQWLPNTAGCYSAREAVALAHMAREIYGTTWIKLEVIGDRELLAPDVQELLVAARELVREGFTVLPFCTTDLIMGQRLLDAGCVALMPWAAPIGTAQGLLDLTSLRVLRARLPKATLIVDAGLGAPSQAAQALEMGYDAVLLNSAVASAGDPARMAQAFAAAVQAGRWAYRAGLIEPRDRARASTPVTAPFGASMPRESAAAASAS